MGATSIQWTDETWNPTRGCDKISPGCKHCYAETFAERWRGVPGHPYEQGFDLRLVPEKLEEPLHWRKPRRVFVNSMSDLFHKDVPFEFIEQVFAVMANAPQHTFQVLTKRAQRMREFFEHLGRFAQNVRAHSFMAGRPNAYTWPLPNVWIGVSVEDQERAKERIPWLLEVPAAVRFLSVEPQLGPVDLTDIEMISAKEPHGPRVALDALRGHVKGPDDMLPTRIDWVIVGGESGHGARPFALEWARSIVAQCKAAGVAVFVKQLGENPVESDPAWVAGRVIRLKDHKGGDPAEWPADLRIREFPAGTDARKREGGGDRAEAQGGAT